MRTRTGLDVWSAPETRVGGNYTESVDYWGIGVIGYFIMMMHPPFFDSDESKLIEKVQNCKYPKFTKEIRERYSPCICDLISKLIVSTPELRPSPTFILSESKMCHMKSDMPCKHL